MSDAEMRSFYVDTSLTLVGRMTHLWRDSLEKKCTRAAAADFGIDSRSFFNPLDAQPYFLAKAAP